ncbi:MAG: hypothetical protein HWE25_04590 [Alphaproteobacteria bacterium]|nr:hypothetical protein [Alphaproteobacteria bacterium]
MRFISILMILGGLLVAAAEPAEARPPFFIRYVDVKSDQHAQDILVADLVNPRSSSVLLKAYIRVNDPVGQTNIQLPNVLLGPASRRSIKVNASDLPEISKKVSCELIIEQQPVFFTGKDEHSLPEQMTITSYIVPFSAAPEQGTYTLLAGKAQRTVSIVSAE